MKSESGGQAKDKMARSASRQLEPVAESRAFLNLGRVALAAGVLAVAAAGVAAFVPRSKLGFLAEPLRLAAESPVATALAVWVISVWNSAPRAPVFDDLRPFDEF